MSEESAVGLARQHDPMLHGPAASKNAGFENPEKAQRFAAEMNYVSHYADRLAGVLGMRRLEFGVLEDRDGQVSFMLVAGSWTGRVSETRRSLSQAKAALSPKR
jgi:hypothetical protein